MTSTTLTPIKREAVLRAAGAGWRLLFYASFLAFCVFNLIAHLPFGLVSALLPTLFLAYALWATIPLILYNGATIYLLPSTLKNRYANKIHCLYQVNAILERLPVHRGFYRIMLPSEMARMQGLQGDFAAAELTYNEMVTKLSGASPQKLPDARDTQTARNQLAPCLVKTYSGMMCIYQGKLLEAELHLADAQEIFEKFPYINTEYGGILHLNQAALALELDNLAAAQTHLAEAHDFFCRNNNMRGFTKRDRQLSCTFQDILLAIFYVKSDLVEKADEYAMRYMDYQEEYTGNTLAIHWLNKLAKEYIIRGELVRAESVLESAYSLGSQVPSHTSCIETHGAFENILQATGRADEVADMKRWIRPVRPLLLRNSSLPELRA